MIGAIIGDIVGSTFETHNVKSKTIPIFAPHSGFTDDTLMTIAIARALAFGYNNDILNDAEMMKRLFVYSMQYIGMTYPTQLGGYGKSFSAWLKSKDPKPYNSFGNGSAMRVSPCGYVCNTLKQTIDISRWSAEVSHNHPEGIKGAEAVGGSVYLARTGVSKSDIRTFVEDNYYNLDFTLNDIRTYYKFDVSCQGSVPQAIEAFLESTSFIDAIRNAISIGGDSDTIAAITGSIAWPYYKIRDEDAYERERLWTFSKLMLGELLALTVDNFIYEFDD